MKGLATALSAILGPARAAELRDDISKMWRWGFAAAGRYRPIPAEETEIVFEKRVPFKGDAPLQITTGVHEQGRMAFRAPRPQLEEADDLIVTPSGGAWRNGCFEERYSAGRPGLRRLLEGCRPDQTLPEAYIVQCAHNDTYGDWVSEYLVPVLGAAPLSAPLLLPATIATKSFVARDLKDLDVDWRTIDRPVRIEKARVLRQQKYFVHFPEGNVRLLRQVFGEPKNAPRPGGVVYLSRYGEASDVAARRYPSLVIEDMIRARGGRVIRTGGATLEDYAAAAADAETVVFDHGSAFYNALGWPMRRAVEIVSDNWWNNAFLMLCNAAGVDDYTIIRGDLGDAHIKERLLKTLDAPLDAAAAS